MDIATTTSDTATTTSSTVGIAIIRILPRREAACSAPRQHGIIDVALQRRAVAFCHEPLLGLRPAVVGLAEAGGLCVVLGTEPAFRIVQAGIDRKSVV